YSMVLRVERQRMVNSEYSGIGEGSAMKAYEQRYSASNTGPREFMRRKGPMDKRSLLCEHCNKTGHSKENCFRLHDFPDWYKELHVLRRKSDNAGRAHAVTSEKTVDWINWGILTLITL
ncbi:UNVERIFIED_CONTAM: hypothetical protein Sindi_2205200, partial [Sesamum indicum]